MIIKIKNLTVDMILGVYEFEKQKSQKVIVNLEIDYNDGNSSTTDNIDDTLNYHPICDDVTAILKDKPYELIETVVEKIGKYLLSYEIVNSAYVEIDKPEAPIEGVESLSVSKLFKK